MNILNACLIIIVTVESRPKKVKTKIGTDQLSLKKLKLAMNTSESYDEEVKCISIRKRTRSGNESDSDSTPEVIDLTESGKNFNDNNRSI